MYLHINLIYSLVDLIQESDCSDTKSTIMQLRRKKQKEKTVLEGEERFYCGENIFDHENMEAHGRD